MDSRVAIAPKVFEGAFAICDIEVCFNGDS